MKTDRDYELADLLNYNADVRAIEDATGTDCCEDGACAHYSGAYYASAARLLLGDPPEWPADVVRYFALAHQLCLWGHALTDDVCATCAANAALDARDARVQRVVNGVVLDSYRARVNSNSNTEAA